MLRRFGNWLSTTKLLQTESYGVDPSSLQGEDWTDFVSWNLLYAQVELAESAQAIKRVLKPWSVYHGGRITEEERVDMVKEIVDHLHFVGNILAALGSTDEELSRFYEEKQAVNADRAASNTYGGDGASHNTLRHIGCEKRGGVCDCFIMNKPCWILSREDT